MDRISAVPSASECPAQATVPITSDCAQRGRLCPARATETSCSAGWASVSPPDGPAQAHRGGGGLQYNGVVAG
eukprot:353447-Chlamydomonas_euryale.AAC.13